MKYKKNIISLETKPETLISRVPIKTENSDEFQRKLRDYNNWKQVHMMIINCY